MASRRPPASPKRPHTRGDGARVDGARGKPGARTNKETPAAGSSTGKKRSGSGLNTSVQLLAVVAIVVLLAVNLVPIGLQWIQQEQEYRAVNAELVAAQERNAELLAALEDWENEDYIASQARSRLGFVRPGETQYTVIDVPQSEQVATESAVTEQRGTAKPWMYQLFQSMADADTPPITDGLENLEPTQDPSKSVLEDETS